MAHPRERPRRFRKINNQPKQDRSHRFSAGDCRLQLQPLRTPDIQLSAVSRATTQESTCTVCRLDQPTSPDPRGAVRDHAKKDQRTHGVYPAGGSRYFTEIRGRPRRKRLDGGIKSDIKTRDGRIGYRRFWAPCATAALPDTCSPRF
jgi:hypothetical protein